MGPSSNPIWCPHNFHVIGGCAIASQVAQDRCDHGQDHLLRRLSATRISPPNPPRGGRNVPSHLGKGVRLAAAASFGS